MHGIPRALIALAALNCACCADDDCDIRLRNLELTDQYCLGTEGVRCGGYFNDDPLTSTEWLELLFGGEVGDSEEWSTIKIEDWGESCLSDTPDADRLCGTVYWNCVDGCELREKRFLMLSGEVRLNAPITLGLPLHATLTNIRAKQFSTAIGPEGVELLDDGEILCIDRVEISAIPP
jgi:hypothetical protein